MASLARMPVAIVASAKAWQEAGSGVLAQSW